MNDGRDVALHQRGSDLASIICADPETKTNRKKANIYMRNTRETCPQMLRRPWRLPVFRSFMRVINFVVLALLLPAGMFTQAQPTIIRNPASQTVPAGAAVTFVLSAGSADVLSYQWSFRGEELSNATNATLRIAKAVENLGSYEPNEVEWAISDGERL